MASLLGRPSTDAGSVVGRASLGALAAVAALLLAGCDGVDPRDRTSGQEGPPVGTASIPGGAQAADRLASAVASVMSSGRYRQTVTTPGLEEPYYEVTGEYDVSGKRFTADMAFWNSEVGATRTIKHTFVGARGFQQAEGWRGRAAGCWLVFDSESGSAVTQQGSARQTEAPAAVLAMNGAAGEASSAVHSNVVEGTIELRSAVSLMLPAFVRQQGTPPDGTVPASFTLDDDGSLSSWEVVGSDVVPAMDEAGADVSNGLVAGLGTFTLHVAYDDLGEPVRVFEPPRSLWMSGMKGNRGCNGS